MAVNKTMIAWVVANSERREIIYQCFTLPGLGYYYISNAMQDTDTVQEQATYVMCDSNTFSYVIPLLLMALRISKT